MTRRIAFYAPLKAPDHPVPSGDRMMARQLIAALTAGGFAPRIATSLRSYLPDPLDQARADGLRAQAAVEVDRIAADWNRDGPPAVWVCYHPYYKSPDLIGPPLCRRFGIAYVTIESSWSGRRNIGVWVGTQDCVLGGLEQAALNICLTRRDRDGIAEVAAGAATALLSPFIDATPFSRYPPAPEPGRLITVAMMRPGDKFESYRLLAESLTGLSDLSWRLSVIGDGPERAAVARLFAPVRDRIDWHGALSTDAVARALSGAALYVWPGCGEAYGIAYLEAQAAGLPVVAQQVAGVPEVVADGQTGLLTPAADPQAFGAAIRRLLTDADARRLLGSAARPRIAAHHTAESASRRLAALLAPFAGPAS